MKRNKDNQTMDGESTVENDISSEFVHESPYTKFEQYMVEIAGAPDTDVSELKAASQQFLRHRVESMNIIERFIFNRKLDSLSSEHILDIGRKLFECERDKILLGFKMELQKEKFHIFLKFYKESPDLHKTLLDAQMTFQISIRNMLQVVRLEMFSNFHDIIQIIDDAQEKGKLTPDQAAGEKKLAEEGRDESIKQSLEICHQMIENQVEILIHTLRQLKDDLTE